MTSHVAVLPVKERVQGVVDVGYVVLDAASTRASLLRVSTSAVLTVKGLTTMMNAHLICSLMPASHSSW